MNNLIWQQLRIILSLTRQSSFQSNCCRCSWRCRCCRPCRCVALARWWATQPLQSRTNIAAINYIYIFVKPFLNTHTKKRERENECAFLVLNWRLNERAALQFIDAWQQNAIARRQWRRSNVQLDVGAIDKRNVFYCSRVCVCVCVCVCLIDCGKWHVLKSFYNFWPMAPVMLVVVMTRTLGNTFKRSSCVNNALTTWHK